MKEPAAAHVRAYKRCRAMVVSHKLHRRMQRWTIKGQRIAGKLLIEGMFDDETAFVVGLALLALYVIGWILVMMVRSIIQDISSGGRGILGLSLILKQRECSFSYPFLIKSVKTLMSATASTQYLCG